MLFQLLTNGLVNGCVYALLALSFALIYNTTRIFHIAHGATYTVGAYIAWYCLIELQWDLAASFAVALLGTALLGVLMELVVLAPLNRRGASPLIALLSSLGLYVALVNVVALMFGNQTQVLSPGVTTAYHLGSIVVTEVQVAEVISAAILLPVFVLLLKFSRWGRSIRAARDNWELVGVLGGNLYAIRVGVFAVGSAVAALAGVLTGLDLGVDPQSGMSAFLAAAVALIIGGVGTFVGPVLGALVLGVLQSLVIWKISARWTDGITFGVLILFLIFRPQGLVGRRRRLEEAWE